MKTVYAKILILFLIIAAVPNVWAQDANNNQQPNQPQTAAVFGENDRLPFMQNQEAQQASNEPSSGSLMLKTLGALLFVVGLIFFGAWGAKKLGFGTAKDNVSDDVQLSILSSVNLGNGRTISTVRFGDRVLVVGSTPQSFTLLAEEAGGEKVSFENSRSVAEMLAEEEEENLFSGENNAFAREFERAQSILNLSKTEEGERI